jgi:N-acetyltransferase 10
MVVTKKVDNRIKILIENGVKERKRSMFVIIGDRGRDQVVNLHYMLSKTVVKKRPSVLWCYKNELAFSSNRKKRMKRIKKKISRGVYDQGAEDPFELFVSSTDIRYSYYSQTHAILGQTFGMCVLQDFESVTPNLLARTIETVEGGGVIVLLMRTMTSLRQLYTLSMDVHKRFRTERHDVVKPRFNERFLLSLADCQSCLVVDDELNILPISSHARKLRPVHARNDDDDEVNSDDDDDNAMFDDRLLSKNDVELKSLKASLADTEAIGPLVSCARTLDQAKALLVFIEAISEKTLRSTVALTAARGRGKSAALGLAMASAVALGYANIFVTAPSPENLKTLFEFLLRGFDALDMKEHLDYELVQSTNPDFHKAIVRVNVFRAHRQTVQYVEPRDYQKLGQAELVIIDEAAAIPLPFVKRLLGPYLVFLSSTVNGYEGTGRSLSLKLLDQLRHPSAKKGGKGKKAAASSNDAGDSLSGGTRVLRELTLQESIRYAPGDRVEQWLNRLLCLDATDVLPSASGCPHPEKCELYAVNRDTLFSFHKTSEDFLQRMMALYVSSHYKNTPDDLLLMSDAPMHRLFVLLGPVDRTRNRLPDILCVVQVALEGGLARDTVRKQLSQGIRDAGDLIPWTISQQFQDYDFGRLDGARVVRIATHPQYQSMGYGSRAVQLLEQYYEGRMQNLDEQRPQKALGNGGTGAAASSSAPVVDDRIGGGKSQLLVEKIKPRRHLPPLLVRLEDEPAEVLHYLGVSFGLTTSLFRFWKRGGYTPLYLRQTPNPITGEHTCIVLKQLSRRDDVSPQWQSRFAGDFYRRFLRLLAFQFRQFVPSTALNVLNAARSAARRTDIKPLDKREMDRHFTLYDLRRLRSYSNNLVDYHVVVDLVPPLADLYFGAALSGHSLDSVGLSPVQAAVLCAIGLQRKTVSDIAGELNLQSNQILALFNKTVRKLSEFLHAIEERAVDESMPSANAPATMKPLAQSLDSDLLDAQREAHAVLRRHDESDDDDDDDDESDDDDDDDDDAPSTSLRGLDMEQYAIHADDSQFSNIDSAALERGRVSLKRAKIAQTLGTDDNAADKKKQSTKKRYNSKSKSASSKRARRN